MKNKNLQTIFYKMDTKQLFHEIDPVIVDINKNKNNRGFKNATKKYILIILPHYLTTTLSYLPKRP